MEVLRGRCRGDDLDVVLRGQGQKAFEAGAGMFRPLSFKAVRQQQDQPAEPVPFVLRAGNELIDDDLRGVAKIPELRLPANQTIRAIQTVTVIKTQHAGFRERAVDDIHRPLVWRPDAATA